MRIERMEYEESILQHKVISYGKHSIIGCAILAFLGALLGILSIVQISQNGYDDFYGLWTIIAFMGFGLFGFSVFGIFYGREMKKAGEDRDISKLEKLWMIWIGLDILFIILTFIMLFVTLSFQYLIVFVAIGVDAYRLHVLWRYIQILKNNDTYSA